MADMSADGGATGVEVGAHITGDPFPNGAMGAYANVTVAHTWFIVVAALVLLWLFGGVVFKGIRM